ncbi:MAG: efflux transporter outer membrane subunit [Rhodocyclaceae bacterium]|jgi:multidrug efflux system outer membrane protein|nr:efflux transporter outer membrane subunit [Rhodocyclaceae bacterium]
MMAVTRLAAALSAVLLGGCASMIPDYQRPDAPVPAHWVLTEAGAAEADADARAPLEALAWKEYFTDPALQALVERALAHNRDLRIAALNIEQARAQYRISRADRLPGVDAGAQQSAQRLPDSLSPSGEAAINRQYSATVGLATYELDFFGRVRSLNEQALARFLASEEAHRSARNTLIAEVANAWLRMGATRELLELASRTSETRRESLELTRRSFEGGVLSALDVTQAETSMLEARADVASLSVQLAEARNALALLVGGQVDEQWLPARIETAFAAVAEVESGIASSVLTRRPDILSLERQLQAANANIGAARAAFFPSITLTASAGVASSELDDLFSGGAGMWSFLPRINLPIFDGGRRAAGLEVAEVQRDIAVAQYEQGIQSAFREVADALALRASLAEQLSVRTRLLEVATEHHRLSEARYRSGLDSYLGLLDAQRTLYAAEQALISTRLSEAGNRVMLYKLLGGGWKD